MKIFIPTHNRSSIISTHKVLRGLDYYIVINDKNQLQQYVDAVGSDDRIIVADTPIGMVNMRNFIAELVPDGHWFCSLDDNIKRVSKVSPEFYSLPSLNFEQQEAAYWRQAFNIEVSGVELANLITETVNECETNGARLGGFATVDNYFFRAKKFRDVGYVIGKAMVIKKGNLRWDKNILAMDDYEFTGANLSEYGRVLINNYIFFHKKHYETGGIGTYEQRLPMKLQDVKYLMNKYEGLFNIKDKKGGEYGAELQIRFHSTEQVADWVKQKTQLAIF